MPRIRTVKPEFWNDEKLSELSALDRFVFLGLIGMSDDFGRLHDNIKVIDAFIFPNTSESALESLDTLSRIGRIRRGNASNGKPVIEIVNWAKHQRVDKPQKHLALPPITDAAIEHLTTVEDSCVHRIPESVPNNSGITPEKVATLPGIRDQGSGIKDLGGGEVKPARPNSKHFSSSMFSEVWDSWKCKQASHGNTLDGATEAAQLYKLESFDTDDAIELVRYCVGRTKCNNLIWDGSHRSKRAPTNQKNRGITLAQILEDSKQVEVRTNVRK